MRFIAFVGFCVLSWYAFQAYVQPVKDADYFNTYRAMIALEYGYGGNNDEG